MFFVGVSRWKKSLRTATLAVVIGMGRDTRESLAVVNFRNLVHVSVTCYMQDQTRIPTPCLVNEFETQSEALGAIAVLEGKPPLILEMIDITSRNSEETLHQQCHGLTLDSHSERQTSIWQPTEMGKQNFHSKQSTVYRYKESAMGIVLDRDTSDSADIRTDRFLPCSVCGTETSLVCTISMTWYCSLTCQENDRQAFQPTCQPLEAVELAKKGTVPSPTSLLEQAKHPEDIPRDILPVHQTEQPVSPNTACTGASTNSVIKFIDAGTIVLFQVTEQLNEVDQYSGMLLRGHEDMPIFDFSLFAENIATVSDFRPTVGSVVCALHSIDNQWYRGCVTKVHQPTYSVLFVDYGNVDENVVSVKPIPANFQNEMYAVKMSCVGNLALATKQDAIGILLPETCHLLEVTTKMADGSALARFHGENVPTCTVTIEPWTSLLAETEQYSALEGLAAPMTFLPYTTHHDSLPQCDVGLLCNVVPLAAEDVDSIYIQTDSEEIKTLTFTIQKELKRYFPYSVVLPTVPVIGSCVAAISPEDGDLYRARITKVTGEAISLIFIDIGKAAIVSLSEIRALPSRCYAYPACSKRVSLARVVRPAGFLPASVQELLVNCVNKPHEMFVTSSTSEWPECILMQGGRILNEEIVDCLENLTNAASNPPNQMPDLEFAAPGAFAIHRDVASLDNTLSDVSYDDGIFLDLPEEGSFEAVITCVDGPHLIMLHAADDQISKKLAELEDDMEEYATSIALGHGPEFYEICLALYSDGKWCRSVCLDVISDPAGARYMCMQVDYGGTHIIDIDDIRRIPRRFIDFLPYLAQHTILEGTEAMKEVKRDLVIRVRNILPQNSKVTVSVVGRDEFTYIVRIPGVAEILTAEGLI